MFHITLYCLCCCVAITKLFPHVELRMHIWKKLIANEHSREKMWSLSRLVSVFPRGIERSIEYPCFSWHCAKVKNSNYLLACTFDIYFMKMVQLHVTMLGNVDFRCKEASDFHVSCFVSTWGGSNLQVEKGNQLWKDVIHMWKCTFMYGNSHKYVTLFSFPMWKWPNSQCYFSPRVLKATYFVIRMTLCILPHGMARM